MNMRKRILAGVLVGLAIPTVIYILLPKSAVVHFAYVSLLLAVVLAGMSLWKINRGGNKEYLTNLAFPLSLKSYLLATAAMAVVFTVLQITGVWTINVVYYVAMYVIVLALTAWKLLTIGAAQEKIQAVGDTAKAQTTAWKSMQADVDAILQTAPPELHNDITAVRDAIRFSDPMSKTEIAALDAAIAKDILELKTLASSSKAVETQALCAKIQTAIKSRNERLKILK